VEIPGWAWGGTWKRRLPRSYGKITPIDEYLHDRFAASGARLFYDLLNHTVPHISLECLSLNNLLKP